MGAEDEGHGHDLADDGPRRSGYGRTLVCRICFRTFTTSKLRKPCPGVPPEPRPSRLFSRREQEFLDIAFEPCGHRVQTLDQLAVRLGCTRSWAQVLSDRVHRKIARMIAEIGFHAKCPSPDDPLPQGRVGRRGFCLAYHSYLTTPEMVKQIPFYRRILVRRAQRLDGQRAWRRNIHLENPPRQPG